MTKKKLAEELWKIAADNNGDREINHGEADDLLIKYINDKEVAMAYDAIAKWYA